MLTKGDALLGSNLLCETSPPRRISGVRVSTGKGLEPQGAYLTVKNETNMTDVVHIVKNRVRKISILGKDVSSLIIKLSVTH